MHRNLGGGVTEISAFCEIRQETLKGRYGWPRENLRARARRGQPSGSGSRSVKLKAPYANGASPSSYRIRSPT